jgi:hypothetical protein
MLRESLTGGKAERLDEMQVIVRRHCRAMSQVGRQQGQFGIDIGAGPVPAQQSIYGKTMSIMPLAA